VRTGKQVVSKSGSSFTATVVRLGVTFVAVSLLLAISKPVLIRSGILTDPQRYRVGERIEVPSDVLGARRTAIVFGRASCSNCERAVPQLQRLNKEAIGRSDVRIWLFTDESQTTWATQSGFTSTAIVRTDFTRYRLSRVPTVLVLDQTGALVEAVEGVTDESMARILDAVR
jgi:hypothetical protein